jgi:hypothetical protein
MTAQHEGARRGTPERQLGPSAPLTQKQIWAIRFFLDREGRVRDRALFDLAIDSKLRGLKMLCYWPNELKFDTEGRPSATPDDRS